MGISATQPLRDAHRALLPELGVLRIAADAVGSADGAEQFDLALRLLERHLLPHMAAEEAALYPTIDRLSGNDATVALRHDHSEIRRRITTLGSLRRSTEPSAMLQHLLRAALYGLDAIIGLHLDREEHLYYPLLDANLSPEESADLVTAIHRIERDLHLRANEMPTIQPPEAR